jgi:hypothetical protein
MSERFMILPLLQAGKIWFLRCTGAVGDSADAVAMMPRLIEENQ